MADNLSHAVTIRWGGYIPDDEKPVETFSFATRAELDAFMTGVASAEGWTDYEIMEDSRDAIVQLSS